jgi:hypothetical protein
MWYKFKWLQTTEEVAEVAIITPEGEELSPEIYTIKDATKAGLLGKFNWKGHPKTMLRWRAVSNAVKFHCPHVMNGFALVEDDDNVNSIQGEIQIEHTDNASKLLQQQKSETTAQEINAEPVAEKKYNVKEDIKSIKDKHEQEVENNIHNGILDEIHNNIASVSGDETGVPVSTNLPGIPVDIQVDILVSDEDLKNIEAGIKITNTDVKGMLEYFKVDTLMNLTVEQGKQANAILKAKAEKIQKANEEVVKEEPKVEPVLEPVKEESAIAKTMREAREKAKNKTEIKQAIAETIQIPSEVCQYLNSIEKTPEAELPDDIIYLKVDCNRGKFKGIEAYPSLMEEVTKMLESKKEPEGMIKDIIFGK